MSLIQPQLTFLQTGPAFFRDATAIIVSALHRKTVAAIRRRRDRATLHALDDRMLKDMGISRCDIDRLARQPGLPR